MDDTPWQDQALCREIGPALFCSDDAGDHVECQRVCRGCPVRAECLRDAMRHEGLAPKAPRVTVRGGLSPNQRARLATTIRARRARDAA